MAVLDLHIHIGNEHVISGPDATRPPAGLYPFGQGLGLGTRLEELSPTDPVLIIGGGAIIVVIYAAHRLRGRLLGEDGTGNRRRPD